MAPTPPRDNPLTRSLAGIIGMMFLGLMLLLCLGTLPWTLSEVPVSGQLVTEARYNAGVPKQGRLPPAWWPYDERSRERAADAVPDEVRARVAAELGAAEGLSADAVLAAEPGTRVHGLFADMLVDVAPRYALGSDALGRSLLIRLLTGGGISLVIGISAALLSVVIGTLYGAIAGYVGGKTDAIMMRVVDVLYGLPYILLVVLLAVASDALIEEHVTRSKARASWVEVQAVAQVEAARGERVSRREARDYLNAHPEVRDDLEARAVEALPRRELDPGWRTFLDVLTLVVAIGGVSWLTMSRVIRGQVLSLKAQPFIEAARAVGAGPGRIFRVHLLPNLVGPIVVYATLSVPLAILQESFLSFLGIGVKPPLPSWGNLAADGLSELNTHRSHWWLLFFPCLLLGLTLLALNFVGEGLREALDPKRARR